MHSGGTSVASVRMFEELPSHPVITVGSATKLLSTTKPTAAKAVQGLVDARILVETTGRKRDRVFSYAEGALARRAQRPRSLSDGWSSGRRPSGQR